MDYPDFRSRATLLAHIEHTLAFYHPRCIDPNGGFFHFFLDDGTVYQREQRHLVSSTRMVFNYAMAYRQFGKPEYLNALKHGVAYLRTAHYQAATGAYAWLLRQQGTESFPLDSSNHCYGLAFVLLAYSHALMAGLSEAEAFLNETFDLMENRFWQAQHGLYADEASADWTALSPYRGQNANMHACEALLAAFEATSNPRYLLRAELVARNIALRQSLATGGLIWEHYQADWSVDWDYNKHDKSNIFRPWGYQPGHFTEWAKLLLILERHSAKLDGESSWMLPRARELFDCALEKAWDARHGGIYYGFGPDDAICDSDKYFWVQAESLAAAALLGKRTGDDAYWDWYQKLWEYSWAHMIDHRHGAWYRILNEDNSKQGNEKSPAGKVDYHTMGACYESMLALRSDFNCRPTSAIALCSPLPHIVCEE